jgi:antitoxin FitA
VKGRRRLRVGGLGRGGLGFGGGTWLLVRGLRLAAAPLRFVDLCLDGWGRGLRPGWRKAAVIHGPGRYQAFDGYDHRKGLDLTGDGAPGGFVAKIGQFPEPGQDLVATQPCIDMCITCNYVRSMARMIQVRNVPDALHRSLKARAAMAGMSLSDYLLGELREIAERPTLAEFRERLHRRKPLRVALDTGGLLREERIAR